MPLPNRAAARLGGPLTAAASVVPTQMEKRSAASSEERVRRCREVLQRALTLNPFAPRIIQAWGLLELQRGNLVPAVRLLERCAAYDPACEPVLRWLPVREAVRSVRLRKRRAS